jgi:hypothetical protein
MDASFNYKGVKMVDYRTLENKIRDIVARPWTKDPKQVHHKLQQIQKKIIDEEPDMLNSKALGIPDSVVEAAKQINKGKTEVDVNPQYKSDAKEPDDEDDKKKSKKEVKENVPDSWETNSNAARKAVVKKNLKVNRDAVTKEELKGNQHKIDKNKNGKIDAQDFKLLRKEEVEQIDEKEVVFTGSPKHTAKKAEEHKKMGYKVVSLKKHKSGIFGDNSEKHTYKMAKEEVEQVDELSKKTVNSYYDKNVKQDSGHWSPDDVVTQTDKKRSAGYKMAQRRRRGEVKMSEEVILSDEEQAKLDAIAATFAEDAIQSAQKSAQQKVKAASITAKATVQADKIKDQARKQAQNNSYEQEGEMLESNLAAQIRDARPSITGHIEVNVGDKKVKIPHRKAQDFLGSYHAKRTADEKDAHEKAFRKEIGG